MKSVHTPINAKNPYFAPVIHASVPQINIGMDHHVIQVST